MVALGGAELAAGALPRVPSLVVAVGDAIIDLAPRTVVEFGIGTFGRDDKTVLVVGILVVALALAALLGVLARHHPWSATAGLAGVAAVGFLAAGRQADTSRPLSALAAGAGVVAGVVGVTLLLASAPVPRARDGAEPIVSGGSRRQFLALAGSLALVAVAAGAGGRALLRGTRAAAARARVVLPVPYARRPPPPPGASLDNRGISPLFTPNDRFYRIDTALVVPDVDVERWRLAVTGMVREPLELTYEELLDLPMAEADVTICCVSNPVGGPLVGTARWLGVPLLDVLDKAGIAEGASQVVGRSVDGFTAGFPTAALRDARTALVAVGMNGEPLPLAHGFPVRLVVAGLYGYVSATKWLTELELTTLDDFDGYWVPRGWAKEAPIKTQSRIDVPRRSRKLAPGRVQVAGVAWAPARGISRVEVQADDEPWADARLAEPVSDAAWRQWVYEWEATPGAHRLRVRATDASGAVQSGRTGSPFPDGATGYHTVGVEVGDP